MFNVLGDVNWTGTLAAFIALVLLGGGWFAFLFSKPYNISPGGDVSAKPVASPLIFAGPPLTSLVITLTSAFLMTVLKIDSWADALVFGLVVGVGYLVANTVTIAINPTSPAHSGMRSYRAATTSSEACSSARSWW
ncbi:DUF1761 domain-containing protein [Streptomyces venezuelae]|uniref:DUF1761 domain-containing protein n=1 Tax=Streptomyces venezuelae TaxID=54571 RepID=A0A5P2DE31_STRVZ|nr:DUF1761 domain-containing protein [Streptomyces venezuelae]QES53424.1 DUF1761 domain-containing protein [Streptomyces venezuelae]